ncbi:hypothetical protein BZG36_01439 [Bifiguratus adelaidae]|uniref:Exportin-4 n=1 Tax=Bifiguratus adelaidae TaxID=1938954 RepID=A0A261Y4Z9_9FUNG|nr:hypothetical protein BZG36_01439 [Bifiguratus adelaidae]
MDDTLRQFEEACADFQVPAKRAAAEQILTRFRQTPGVLGACQHILDHTTSPIAQFQASIAIKENIIREYSTHDLDNIVGLKNYLLNFCLHHTSIPKYVRDQLLVTVAIIIKRSYADSTISEKDNISDYVRKLVEMGGSGSTLGMALAGAIVDEFSSTKSSSMGLSLEYHYNCKMDFERKYLRNLFELAFAGMSHEAAAATASSSDKAIAASSLEQSDSFKESLSLVDKILQWDFLNGNARWQETFSQTAVKASAEMESERLDLKPTNFPSSWSDMLGSEALIRTLFGVKEILQDNPSLHHRLLQCLLQVVGVTMDCLLTTAQANIFSANMMQGILDSVNKLLSSPSVSDDYVLLSVAQVMRCFLDNMPYAILLRLDTAPNLFFEFLEGGRKITLRCLHALVSDPDDTWSSAALDECLEIWCKLAEGVGEDKTAGGSNLIHGLDWNNRTADPFQMSKDEVEILRGFLGNIGYTIVEAYINTRMELAKQSAEDEGDFEDEYKDWETYGDQLLCIATLGRLAAQQVIQRLQHCLDDRIARLKTYFSSPHEVNEAGSILALVQEHIHWLVLISAFVLADDSTGEKALIPPSIMALSISQDSEPTSQVLALSQTIFGLLDFVSQWSSNDIEASYCSPQVSETLFWFLERWVQSYILLDESDYGQVSSRLAKAFGKRLPSEGQGAEFFEYLISKLQANFVLWNAEVDVLQQMVRLLEACHLSIDLREGVLQCSNFPAFVKFVTDQLQYFPETIHSDVIQVLASLSTDSMDPSARSEYFGFITATVENRLSSVLHNPQFNAIYQEGQVMESVLNALDMFDGLAQACNDTNSSTLYEFFARFLPTFVQVMAVYSTAPEVQLAVLIFYRTFVKYLNFATLSSEQKQFVYQNAHALIQEYNKINSGRKRFFAQEEVAEQPYADVSTILEILSNVMASEFDGVDSFNNVGGRIGSSNVAGVVLYGLDVIIPIIDLEMLKIPQLCTQYIRLISNLVEFFPDSLIQIPPELFAKIMESLAFGLSHDIADLARSALQAVTQLALFAHNEHLKSGTEFQSLTESLHKFLESTLDMLLFKDFDYSLLSTAGETMIALVCAQRAYYNHCAHHLISSQPPSIQPRLGSAFHTLDVTIPSHLPETLSYRDTAEFHKALGQFLMTTRGILRIK